MARNGDTFSRHTLNLFAGDYERIQDAFPDVGAAPIIRRIVREFAVRLEGNPTARPGVTFDV